MKVDDFLSRANLAKTPELSANFARRVIVEARAVQRRRRLRGRMAGGVAVILLAAIIPRATHLPWAPHLPWANRLGSPLVHLAASGSPAYDASYRPAGDQTDAFALAETADPDAVGDYLIPNASALAQFAAGYSDASWEYDPDWAGDSASSDR